MEFIIALRILVERTGAKIRDLLVERECGY